MLPSEITAFANEKLAEHGLDVKGWRFEFDRAKRRFGSCRYSKKIITVSIHLCALNSADEIMETILHEIAHALVGGVHGHNHIWRRTALQIGSNGKRCHTSDTVAPKFIGTCDNCGRRIERHRRKKISCGVCSPNVWNPNFLFRWSVNNDA